MHKARPPAVRAALIAKGKRGASLKISKPLPE